MTELGVAANVWAGGNSSSGNDKDNIHNSNAHIGKCDSGTLSFSQALASSCAFRQTFSNTNAFFWCVAAALQPRLFWQLRPSVAIAKLNPKHLCIFFWLPPKAVTARLFSKPLPNRCQTAV